MTHSPHLQLSHSLLEILDVLASLFDLSIETLLNLRIGGLSHSNRGMDERFLSLDLVEDLIDKVIVIHGCGAFNKTKKVKVDMERDSICNSAIDLLNSSFEGSFLSQCHPFH